MRSGIIKLGFISALLLITILAVTSTPVSGLEFLRGEIFEADDYVGVEATGGSYWETGQYWRQWIAPLNWWYKTGICNTPSRPIVEGDNLLKIWIDSSPWNQ